MQVITRVLTGGTVETLDAYASLQEALDDIHGLWLEDGGEGFPVYVLTDEDGRVLATVVRSATTPTVAITTRYEPDGPRVEQHACSYNLDQNGRYLSTVVRDCLSGAERVLTA